MIYGLGQGAQSTQWSTLGMRPMGGSGIILALRLYASIACTCCYDIVYKEVTLPPPYWVFTTYYARVFFPNTGQPISYSNTFFNVSD